VEGLDKEPRPAKLVTTGVGRCFVVRRHRQAAIWLFFLVCTIPASRAARIPHHLVALTRSLPRWLQPPSCWSCCAQWGCAITSKAWCRLCSRDTEECAPSDGCCSNSSRWAGTLAP
jgi:hypothetical protein